MTIDFSSDIKEQAVELRREFNRKVAFYFKTGGNDGGHIGNDISRTLMHLAYILMDFQESPSNPEFMNALERLELAANRLKVSVFQECVSNISKALQNGRDIMEPVNDLIAYLNLLQD